MAIQKFVHQVAARIAAGTSTIQANQSLLLSNTQSHGHMAPSFRRKNLVCFYCNKKSGIKYDGCLTQWECTHCQSTNFLDENGDITDPPVATDYAALVNIKYATSRPDTPSSSQASESSLFCSACLKNQHLYTASLAQYHVETDPSHPQYRELERKYFAYKKGLERRYPQVCEDCEPRVLERMREAGRTAKIDHLRRLMDKSRATRATTVNKITLSGSFDFAGKCLWYVGLAGQLLWSTMALVAVAQQSTSTPYPFALPLFFTTFLTPVISLATSDMWTRSSLLCSVAAIWWNPMFKQMKNGFMNHIKGFGDFYRLQFLLIVIRSLFYYTMGTGVFADPFSSATTGAHLFIFGFVTLLALKARHSLKVDMSPLWATTPEKLPNVGPRPRSPTPGPESMTDVLNQISAGPSPRANFRSLNQASETMGDVLDEIAATSSRESRQLPQRLPPGTQGHSFPQNGLGRNRLYQPTSIRPSNPNASLSPRRTSPSLLEMTQSEARLYLATGEVPQRLQQQQNGNDMDVEEMEWSPSRTRSQYRAFKAPPRALQPEIQHFGEAPASDQSSPFWYKLPPAPVTPAQRLRNPPPEIKLRVSSNEVKENFFNNVTHRTSGADKTHHGRSLGESENAQQGIAFAQQKFFPPPPPSEAGNALADLLTSFSLSNPEVERPKSAEKSSSVRHALQGLALFLGLYFWNYTFINPSEHSTNIMLVVMIGCVLIGVWTILDNTVFAVDGKMQPIWQSLGACFGGFECATAGYGILEILAGRADCEDCASLGTILIGGMLVHEIWLALFGH